MSDYLSEDEREWGEELLEQMYEIESAAGDVIPQLESILNGEQTIAEYEEWVDNNDEVLEAFDF